MAEEVKENVENTIAEYKFAFKALRAQVLFFLMDLQMDIEMNIKRLKFLLERSDSLKQIEISAKTNNADEADLVKIDDVIKRHREGLSNFGIEVIDFESYLNDKKALLSEDYGKLLVRLLEASNESLKEIKTDLNYFSEFSDFKNGNEESRDRKSVV